MTVDVPSMGDMIGMLISLWDSFAPWQKILIPALALIFVALSLYHSHRESEDPSLYEERKQGPLAGFALSNDELKLAGIAALLFLVVVVGGGLLVAM